LERLLNTQLQVSDALLVTGRSRATTKQNRTSASLLKNKDNKHTEGLERVIRQLLQNNT